MRCFVIRGFGKKKDAKGNEIDFDKVDQALIAPALLACKLDGNTTAKVVGAGSIHQDMFQLILQEELVLCDITVHNPNVFYELGVRHALRKRRTVLIKGTPSADSMPFDIAGIRYMTYPVGNPGAALAELVSVINATLADEKVTDSPVFLMMPTLPEADVQSVTTVPLDFVEEVQQAEARKDRGWLRLLAEDVSAKRFAREGYKLIGRAQWKLKDFKAATRTWETALRGAQADAEADFALANIYERLYRQDGDPADIERSNQAVRRLLGRQNLSPGQRSEARALEGRNLKTLWRLGFAGLGSLEARREHAIDKRAMESYAAYRDAYKADLNNFFPGLAALQMGRILQSLAQSPNFQNLFDDEQERDRYVQDRAAELTPLEHVVRASIKRAIAMEKGDSLIWANISAADLRFLTIGDAPSQASIAGVVQAYRDAVPKGGFYADAACGQLELFEQLGVGGPAARAVLDVLAKSTPGKRHVVVFSGHNVDTTGAEQPAEPRFPSGAQGKARELIKSALASLRRNDEEIDVLVSAAPGADILALEACRELKLTTWLCLPVQREVVARDVFSRYDIEWRNRFFALADAQPQGRTFVLSDNGGLPAWLEASETVTPWSRGNRWMLRQAQAWGADRVTLLALWDHNKDDKSPNGTAAILKLAQATDGIYIELIDCRQLAAG